MSQAIKVHLKFSLTSNIESESSGWELSTLQKRSSLYHTATWKITTVTGSTKVPFTSQRKCIDILTSVYYD